MPSQSDVREFPESGKPRKKRRFDKRDFNTIAEFVIDEHARRKRDRADRERQWDEVDRQLRMEPDTRFKLLPNGQVDHDKLWMSEMELPLQAQTLEVLTADARRMIAPDSGSWFRAHTEVTDEYLARVDFGSFILGDENDVPTEINQDNADKLAEGFLLHHMRQYDFFSRMDMINAEAFKYGMGVGRMTMQTKNQYIHEARGVRKDSTKMPVLQPVSIRRLYLDDKIDSSYTAETFGPSHIAEDSVRLENLLLMASKGSTDPDNEDGGWMPEEVRSLEPDNKGFVEILEWEGDLVVPRSTTPSVVIPGAIVTVAKGVQKGGKSTHAVVRFRFRKDPFSSYLLFPYHIEDIDNPYPSSPLMKGRTVQMMATEALNKLLDSAALKNAPPVGYDRSDQWFAANGGPVIHPYAQWGTIDQVHPYVEIGGDPGALSNSLSLAINLYAELTGVLPARVGAQTNSHTTAFAKDAELQRGAVRTVDFVRTIGHGPLTRWLDIQYRKAREALDRKQVSFFIDAYGGFVEIGKEALPERASFEWFGSGGPQEEAAKSERKMQALQLAMQMDQLNVQMGGEPVVDLSAAIRETLREGKWTDVDAITRLEGATGGTQASPALPGASEGGGGPTTAALQALAGGTGGGGQG